jgi:hypothetical protein
VNYSILVVIHEINIKICPHLCHYFLEEFVLHFLKYYIM